MSFCAYLSKDLTQQHHSMGSLYFCVGYIVAHYVKSMIYLFDGKNENSDAIGQSVDGKPKNFSTICSNKLRNCQFYGLQRWTHFKSSLSCYVRVSLTNCILQALLIPEANIVITSRTRARTRTYHVHN